MISVTIFRHVPAPIIGLVGVLHDRDFEAFEATLDWLETTGLLLDRFDPATSPEEVASRPIVQEALAADPDHCLPLILVNEVVVSKGVLLSRAQLARAVGRARHRGRQATRSAA